MNSHTSTRILQKVCIAKLSDLYKEQRAFKIAEALSNEGYQCDVVGLDSREGNIIPEQNNISIHPVTSIFNNRSRIFTPIRVITKFITYITYMYSAKADIYCAHDVISIAIACSIKMFKSIKIVYIGDELEYARSSDNYFISFRNYIIKWSLIVLFRYCDIIMQADIARAEALATMYDLKRVYYLRNVARKRSEINPINLREKFSLPVNSIILMYHGLIGFGRGIEKTIQCLYEIDSSLHITFIIIGWGEKKYLDKLNHLISCNNIANRKIIIHNGVDSNAIWSWISNADIGMANIQNTSLSYYLAAPTKLYEYMMAGVPVILSDFPENKLVMKQSNCGLLVNPENIKELKESVIQLAQNPNKRKILADNGKKAALEIYNWEEEQKILIKVIRDIAG